METIREEQTAKHPEPYFNTTKQVYFATLLNKYAAKLRINQQSNASLIDVGCGTGEELVHHIIPTLPKDKIVRFVGVDKVMFAVDTANRRFGNTDKDATPIVSFMVLNIESLIFLHMLTYDYVTSFWCMHLVRDQFRAIKNMHRLLKPGGCLLMSFVMKSVFFEVISALAQYPKYEEYIRDVSVGISPYQYSLNPRLQLVEYLQQAGFDLNDYEVNLINTVYLFDTREVFDASVRSLNTFHSSIPSLLHTEFYEDCLSELKNRQCISIDNDGSFTCKLPALVVDVFARRPLVPNPPPEPKDETFGLGDFTPFW